MGYTTDFSGAIKVEPPLSPEEIAFINKFAATRRMDREEGPYFVDGPGLCGQGGTPGIRDYNRPPKGQPGLWCQWVATEDGQFIEWDGGEKFYASVDWMIYLIEHFLARHACADLPFLQKNHVLNGEILAQGESINDRWKLIVTANAVTTKELE